MNNLGVEWVKGNDRPYTNLYNLSWPSAYADSQLQIKNTYF